jgi:hypothetical protein
MEWANVLRAAAVVGALGFITTLGSSFLLLYCIRIESVAYASGIAFCALAAIFLIFTFVPNREWGKRLIYLFTALLLAGGGVNLLFLPYSYHLTAHYINRVAVYTFIVLPLQFALTSAWPIFTKLMIGPILTASKIGGAEELVLYLSCTFIGSNILAAVVPNVKGVSHGELATNALMPSIFVWFVGAVLSAGMGILIERRSDETDKAALDIQPATSRPKPIGEARPSSPS